MPRRSYTLALPGGATLQLGVRPLVMGILNVTPDSFGEQSPCLDPGEAIDLALGMEADGADLIDVGGESTRPGADPVPAEEELRRVLPVVAGLARQIRIPISIDTYKASVARAAIDAGAAIVNDVSGLRFDPALATVVADSGAALVLMHMRGDPKSMRDEAVYGDLMADVVRELRDRLSVATQAGVPRAQIIVDPGIGFAKRPAHSYRVLGHLPDLAAALDRPLLVGASRKSFMRAAVGDRPAFERDWGTAAAVSAAVLSGAHILRVHAVGPMVQVVRVAEEIRAHSDQR